MLLAVRVAWFALPVAAGPALARGLTDSSTAVQAVAALLLWMAWGAVAVAVLVPRTVSLTALRVGAPAALGASIWATVHHGDVGGAEIAAIAWTALVAAVVLFVPQVTDVFVDGSSYGPERRMALRTPGLLLLGPVELAWAIVVAGIATGPLLLAAGAWLAGALAVVAGAVLVRPALRSLHQLSRRWLVFVRVGFVLHDPLSLAEPVLVQKSDIAALEPARVESVAAATDVTGRALGLALELRLRESIRIGLIHRKGHTRSIDTDRLLFTPVRPGALLAEARGRGIG